MKASVRPWLETYSWEFVTGQNVLLCLQKNTLHKPTSDGHANTKSLSEQNYKAAMTLAEAADGGGFRSGGGGVSGFFGFFGTACRVSGRTVCVRV